MIIQLAYLDGKKVLSRNTNKKTQLHMLNNCPKTVRNGRYTWRHNSVLFTMSLSNRAGKYGIQTIC